MDEKQFKKHLQDLAHGHHHPEEHDWKEPKKTAAKRPAAKKSKPKAKRAA